MLASLTARFRGRKADAPAQAEITTSKLPDDERQLRFDMFMHLSYMASLATAKVSRNRLFAEAAKLHLSSTVYFRDIQALADKLAIDYAEACRMVAERSSNPDMAALLLRIGGSLNSGEEEAEFLAREAAALGEQYSAHYERDVESLKKWTDGYVALVVSVALVVIVSIISMMIYSIGNTFLIGVTASGCMAVGMGAWILYMSSPKEVFARRVGLTSRVQKRAGVLFKMIFPPGAAIAAIVLLFFGLGPALLVLGFALLPAGFFMAMDAKRMAKRDSDIAIMVRLLGGVTSAIGTTVTEALSKIDRRSMPALAEDLRTLEIRLKAGIKAEVCWNRFVEDNGSELIDRSVKIFYDAIAEGGDPGQIGKNASFYASKIALLREKRALVAATFGYLLPPLHASIVGLLVFIINVLGLFSTTLLKSAPDTSTTSNGNAVAAGASDTFGVFTSLNMDFLNALVMTVALVLTSSNAAVSYIVAGGHRLRLAYPFAMMLLMTGALMTFLPGMAASIFDTITAPPS